MNAIQLNGLWGYLQGLSLTASNQRWLGERLIEQAKKEEHLMEKASQTRRVFKVRRRSACSPSDEELAARFAGKNVPQIPEDPEWRHVIDANTGKTIKPIEKWL
ncbi:MAG: hypothetical protein IKQ37_07160 [Bacteroidaceae bacterium]|nr:hypothetical protein [Bacteroidaceae bacterium]